MVMATTNREIHSQLMLRGTYKLQWFDVCDRNAPLAKPKRKGSTEPTQYYQDWDVTILTPSTFKGNLPKDENLGLELGAKFTGEIQIWPTPQQGTPKRDVIAIHLAIESHGHLYHKTFCGLPAIYTDKATGQSRLGVLGFCVDHNGGESRFVLLPV
ncbi:MAG: hypothetical protein U0821_00875 [Chloroflexota bacterium]